MAIANSSSQAYLDEVRKVAKQLEDTVGVSKHSLAGSATEEQKEIVLAWFNAVCENYGGDVLRKMTVNRYDIEKGSGDSLSMYRGELRCEITIDRGESLGWLVNTLAAPDCMVVYISRRFSGAWRSGAVCMDVWEV